MKKKLVFLLAACIALAVVLWWKRPLEVANASAPAGVDNIGQTELSSNTDNQMPTASDKTVSISTGMSTGAKAEPVDTADEAPGELDEDEEGPVQLERSAPTPYPGESEGAFEFRIRLLDTFDAFVEEADLTDEEVTAVKVAVYDAQSGFGEISRRVYRRPRRLNWIDEASDDAERLRREMFSSIASVVGKERARLLPITFGTGLEVVSHRLFLKPGQPPVDLDLEKTYP